MRRRLPDQINPPVVSKKYGRKLAWLFLILMTTGIGFGFWYDSLQKQYTVKTIDVPPGDAQTTTVQVDPTNTVMDMDDPSSLLETISTLPASQENTEELIALEGLKNDELVKIYNEQESKASDAPLPKGSRPLHRSVGLV